MSRSVFLSLWIVASLNFAFIVTEPSRLSAQAISGDLVGKVQDITGTGVPSASIAATNVATNIRSIADSNSEGEYRLSNLAPGTYMLRVTARGLATLELNNVAVSLNQTTTANVTLQVAQLATSVDVVEAPALVDTTTAQVQNTFRSKEAADLPNTSVGYGVLNFSLLSAGVASSGGVGYGIGPSVGGQRPTNNNFTVEGVDNNSKSVTGPQVVIPNDAVQEFTLIQNQFQAEYGHSSGGQFATIVKSGTNQFHGELYEYNANRKYNALDQLAREQGITSLPRYDQNRLGANFGGPIRKNKWFFFMDFEYNPLGQASSSGGTAYAPTAAGYSELSSLPGISTTNLQVLQKYAVAPTASADAPSLVVGNTTIPVGVVPTVGPNYLNDYYGVLSSDYNLSDKDQLRGRFVWNRGDTIDTQGAVLPVFYSPVAARDYLATIAWYHTFTASVTNEFRLGYNRQNQDFGVGDYKFPGLDQFPTIVLNDLGLQIGPNSSFPQYNVSSVYEGIDNLIWVKGSHTLKFGTEFRKYIAPSLFVQRARGDYEYNETSLYLTDGTPDNVAQRGLGNSTYYGDQIASYSYAQDTWRVRPNLTLDLGIRYEHTTVPYSNRLQTLNSISDVPGLITFNEPQAPKLNFAPRVGFAYSPGTQGNTSIRGGFGMAYDVLFDNLGSSALPPQLTSLADLTNSPTPPAGFLAAGGIPANTSAGSLTQSEARAATSAFIPFQTLPYSLTWNLNIQHVFAKDYTVEVGYLGTRGVHLPIQLQIDKTQFVTPSAYIPTYTAMPSAATLSSLPYSLGYFQGLAAGNSSAIAPQFLNAGFQEPITAFEPEGWSTYHALTIQLNRRFSKGFQMLGAYTWSHNIDVGTAVVDTTELSPRRPQDFFDLSAEKASSALDRRQRFTLSLIYEAPWFRSNNHWFLKNLVGNWEIAPIYTYESPEYYTPQSGDDANFNGDAAGDRTIVNPAGQAGTGTDVYGVDSQGNTVPVNSSSIVAYVAVNPNARYIQAARGALANGGRNTQPIRPIDNVDISIIKRFNITERIRLQLAAQAYNVFNHPQFTPGRIDDVGLTTTTGIASYTFPTSPFFNDPTQIFSSNPRSMQMFAKFSW